MNEKPERIYRDSIRRGIQKALVNYDSSFDIQSIAGKPAPIGDFYVVPILQISNSVFERFRALSNPISDGYITGHVSLTHAALSHVLDEAHDELLRPDPGRNFLRVRSATEINLEAARSFMHTPSIALKDKTLGGSMLFDSLNEISSLMYEGARGKGKLLFANPNSGSVDMTLTFDKTIPFRESRWARKTLEMASGQLSLVADSEKIIGLGHVTSAVDPWSTQDVFQVEFLDHFHWRLSCGNEVLLVCRNGTPSLPLQPFPIARWEDSFRRVFSDARPSDVARFMKLVEVAIGTDHGCTLVVAQDAKQEAERLQLQGTRVSPTRLTPELLRQVSSIDGAVLIDPHGVCFAVGLILDGAAHPACTPARGSRYNSAVRYVYSCSNPRLAVIVSSDETVDVVPLLRPKINLSAILHAIDVLESASKENYHESIDWLDRHRFYLDEKQCERVNAALERIDNEPREIGEVSIVRRKFVPDPAFNESYLECSAVL